jgi:hypothetical protein
MSTEAVDEGVDSSMLDSVVGGPDQRNGDGPLAI